MTNVFKITIDKNRVYGLDILRCFAILFVMIEHGNNFLPESITKYLRLLVFDGVGLFFVLSGFLIGGILIKSIEKEGLSFYSLIQFWFRRWFRTIPAYLLVLILLTIVELLFRHNFPINIIGRYYVFSQNIFYNHPDWFKEAWSLSVEEWFYILVPLILFFISKIKIFSNRKGVIFIAVFILLSVTLFRLYKYNHIGDISINDANTYWDLAFRKQVITRLDSLMYGIIAAYILHYYPIIWAKFKKPLLFCGTILLLTQKLFFANEDPTYYNCVFSFSINSLGALMLLPFFSGYKNGKGSIYKIISIIALISYAMYLLNLSVVSELIMWPLDKLQIDHGVLSILKYCLFWIITVPLSIVFYKYYERPMTALREKINFRQKRRNV